MHLPLSPGGVVAIETPIRLGEEGAVTSEMRTPSQGFALGLGYDPWDIQAAREKLIPRKSCD